LVLLVEDDPQVRALARDILLHANYGVLDAENGDRAVQLAAEHAGQVDLLLTDVIMPQTSGPTLAGRLLALHPRLKVIYMSGYTDGAIGKHGVLDPDVAFLSKPFTPRSLTKKVEEVLGPRPAAAAQG